MSGIKVGMYVKDKTKKYAPVGMVNDVLEDGSQTASVEFSLRYGRVKTYEAIKIENLIHACKRNTVSGFERSMCGRPVKEDDLCGIHAAADRRVKANRVREEEERDAARRRRDEMAQLRAQMEDRIERLDITGEVTVERPQMDTVTIPLTLLEELIERDRNR